MAQRFDALCRQLSGPQLMPAFMRVCAALVDAMRVHVVLMRWHAHADKLVMLAPQRTSTGSATAPGNIADRQEGDPQVEDAAAAETRRAAERQLVVWLHGGSDFPEEAQWAHVRHLPDPAEATDALARSRSAAAGGSSSSPKRDRAPSSSTAAAVALAAGFTGKKKQSSAESADEGLLQEASAMGEGL